MNVTKLASLNAKFGWIRDGVTQHNSAAMRADGALSAANGTFALPLAASKMQEEPVYTAIDTYDPDNPSAAFTNTATSLLRRDVVTACGAAAAIISHNEGDGDWKSTHDAYKYSFSPPNTSGVEVHETTTRRTRTEEGNYGSPHTPYSGMMTMNAMYASSHHYPSSDSSAPPRQIHPAILAERVESVLRSAIFAAFRSNPRRRHGEVSSVLDLGTRAEDAETWRRAGGPSVAIIQPRLPFLGDGLAFQSAMHRERLSRGCTDTVVLWGSLGARVYEEAVHSGESFEAACDNVLSVLAEALKDILNPHHGVCLLVVDSPDIVAANILGDVGGDDGIIDYMSRPGERDVWWTRPAALLPYQEWNHTEKRWTNSVLIPLDRVTTALAGSLTVAHTWNLALLASQHASIPFFSLISTSFKLATTVAECGTPEALRYLARRTLLVLHPKRT